MWDKMSIILLLSLLLISPYIKIGNASLHNADENIPQYTKEDSVQNVKHEYEILLLENVEKLRLVEQDLATCREKLTDAENKINALLRNLSRTQSACEDDRKTLAVYIGRANTFRQYHNITAQKLDMCNIENGVYRTQIAEQNTTLDANSDIIYDLRKNNSLLLDKLKSCLSRSGGDHTENKSNYAAQENFNITKSLTECENNNTILVKLLVQSSDNLMMCQENKRTLEEKMEAEQITCLDKLSLQEKMWRGNLTNCERSKMNLTDEIAQHLNATQKLSACERQNEIWRGNLTNCEKSKDKLITRMGKLQLNVTQKLSACESQKEIHREKSINCKKSKDKLITGMGKAHHNMTNTLFNCEANRISLVEQLTDCNKAKDNVLASIGQTLTNVTAVIDIMHKSIDGNNPLIVNMSKKIRPIMLNEMSPPINIVSQDINDSNETTYILEELGTEDVFLGIVFPYVMGGVIITVVICYVIQLIKSYFRQGSYNFIKHQVKYTRGYLNNCGKEDERCIIVT